LRHSKLANFLDAGDVKIVATRKRAHGRRRNNIETDGAFNPFCSGFGRRLPVHNGHAELVVAALFPVVLLAFLAAITHQHASAAQFYGVYSQTAQAIRAFVGPRRVFFLGRLFDHRRLADNLVAAFPVRRLARLAARLDEAALPAMADGLRPTADADVIHVNLNVLCSITTPLKIFKKSLKNL
jgi:hypothetical protein